MADQRRRNTNWSVTDNNETVHATTWQNFWAAGTLAVLMDVREELQQLNRTLSCPNFLGLPRDIAVLAKAEKRKEKERMAKRKQRALEQGR